MPTRPKILNVDDDEIGRFAVTQMLRSAGFDVDEAASGSEALAKAEALPDIMLLDVRMPDIDGFEVCHRIKSNPRTAGITVVHMSATSVDSQAVTHGLNWGADGYLTEPIAQAELIATLRAFLRIRQAEAAQRFLGNAASVLSGVLDSDSVLAQLAPLAVSFFSELCIVDKLDDQGVLHTAATARTRPGSQPDSALWARAYGDGSEPGIARAAQTGQSMVGSSISDPVQLAQALGLSDPSVVAELLPATFLSVPLIARSRGLGVITIVTRSADRHYTQRDLSLLEDLASRSALLVDNARLYEQAQKAIATRENLLAIVSHDLKDPLNSVVMGCEMLRETVADPTTRRRVDIMQRSAKRMDHLIHDLLDLASLDRGSFSVTRQLCAVEQLVDDVFESFQPSAAEKTITFTLDKQPPLGQLSCDRERVHQVLSNLLSNAIKFTSKGGQIRLAAEPGPGRVTFRVTDSGPGIAPTQLPHVFDRFWQANRTARQGTGLGLSIAKGIVDAHGGTILVQSEVGLGSTFEVILPATSG